MGGKIQEPCADLPVCARALQTRYQVLGPGTMQRVLSWASSFPFTITSRCTRAQCPGVALEVSQYDFRHYITFVYRGPDTVDACVTPEGAHLCNETARIGKSFRPLSEPLACVSAHSLSFGGTVYGSDSSPLLPWRRVSTHWSDLISPDFQALLPVAPGGSAHRGRLESALPYRHPLHRTRRTTQKLRIANCIRSALGCYTVHYMHGP